MPTQRSQAQRVFELLERNISEKRCQGREFELTSVLDEVRAEEGMIGFRTDGERFDLGLPEMYRRTINQFGVMRSA